MNEKTRGRPRQYDREQVLASVLSLFSEKGYSATSLDEISEAMNMSRPSIYNAFGDKESIYLHAMDSFRKQMRRAVGKYLDSEYDLETALVNTYLSAIKVYFSSQPAQGCFIFCTAPAEVINQPEIKAKISDTLIEVDRFFSSAIHKCPGAGGLSKKYGCIQMPENLHRVCCIQLPFGHERGESQASLKRFIEFTVPVLCQNLSIVRTASFYVTINLINPMVGNGSMT